jgi:hypothetical protein
MFRDARNVKKLKAALRAKFALQQRLERIDHEEDVVLKAVNEFMGKAQLPDPPDLNTIEVDLGDLAPDADSSRKA